MTQRMAKHLSDMEIDEISLVDRPANQHARIAIAKRASEEETVPTYTNEAGEAITDLDALNEGDVVYDEAGNAYVYTVEDDDIEDEQEMELDDDSEPVTKSLSEQVREDLSKALSEIERDEVISKALGEISKAEQRAKAAEAIAKAERDLRLTREYISKAAEYNLPVEPDKLGPVLMRMADTMSYEDCAVIHKALTSAGEIFTELGVQGMGDNADPFEVAEAMITEDIQKSAGDGASREQLVAKAFETNPRAYDEYLAQRNR